MYISCVVFPLDWWHQTSPSCELQPRNHLKSWETPEDHQLKSQSQGCICQFSPPVSFKHILDACHDMWTVCWWKRRDRISECPCWHTPELSYKLPIRCQVRWHITRSKTRMQGLMTQTCLFYVTWDPKGPWLQEACVQQGRRVFTRVLTREVEKGLLVVLTDTTQETWNTMKLWPQKLERKMIHLCANTL